MKDEKIRKAKEQRRLFWEKGEEKRTSRKVFWVLNQSLSSIL